MLKERGQKSTLIFAIRGLDFGFFRNFSAMPG